MQDLRNMIPPKTREVLLTLGVLLGGYVFILLVAGLLSPLVYWVLSPYIPSGFERYVDRLRWVGVLCLLPVWWKIAKGRVEKLISWEVPSGSWFLFVFGALSVLATALAASILGGYGFIRGEQTSVTYAIPLSGLVAMIKFLVAAFVVSILEEFVFRGIVQRIWIRGFGQVLGVWVGAFFFAWLHGRPAMDWVSPHLGLGDGLGLAWAYLSALPANITPVELINLTMLGGLLGTLYIRTQSIWPPIFLHAGIVAMMGWLPGLAGWLGVHMPVEQLVELPAATVMLALWAVAVSFWVSPQDDAIAS